jgi:hypothetical protein
MLAKENHGILELPERPPVKIEDIPVSARFADPEIAAAIMAVKTV